MMLERLTRVLWRGAAVTLKVAVALWFSVALALLVWWLVLQFVDGEVPT